MARRERLGSRRTFGYRQLVYRGNDAFEIDEIEGYDVTRKRVFYDDVVLVTRHRFVPWANAIALALLATLIGLLSLALLGASANWAVGVAVLFGLPSVGAVAALFVVGGQAVTVQGKRSQVRMDYVFRGGRAESTFALACRLARERQQRLLRQSAARERAVLAAAGPRPPAPPAPAA